MRFNLFFLASLLPAAAMAGEALGPAAQKKVSGGGQDKNGNPLSHNGVPNDRAGRPPSGNNDATNLCGSTTWVQVPVDQGKIETAPTKEDTLALAASVGQGTHRWQVPLNGREIVRYKSVAFFAKASGEKAAIGNADVSNLLEDAANEHSQSGYVSITGKYKQFVSEEGPVACDDTNKNNGIQAVDVEWRISVPSDRYPSDSPNSKGSGSGSGSKN